MAQTTILAAGTTGATSTDVTVAQAAMRASCVRGSGQFADGSVPAGLHGPPALTC